jgi:hypothetical protein
LTDTKIETRSRGDRAAPSHGTRCLCAVRDKRSGECFGALAGDEAGGLALYTYDKKFAAS